MKRIERGLYFISSSGGDNLYEIASQIVFPSYISLFAALYQLWNFESPDVIFFSEYMTELLLYAGYVNLKF